MKCVEDEDIEILPAVVQGEVFILIIDTTDDANLDFNSTDVTIYLDPPKKSAASRIVFETADGVIADDGLSITFTKDQDWTTALVAGIWDIRICTGSRDAPSQQIKYYLPIEKPTKGALS